MAEWDEHVFYLLLPLKPEEATEPTSTLVPFLQKYSDIRNKKPSVSVSAHPGKCCNKVTLFELHSTSDQIKASKNHFMNKPLDIMCDSI